MRSQRRSTRKMRRLAWLLSGFLIGSHGELASAHATEDGDDEVLLKDGGSIRGTLLAVEANERVVVLEPAERVPREIAWANVAEIMKGKYAGSRRLRVVSDTPVEVREELPDESSTVLCVSPCDRALDVSPRRHYFVTAEGAPSALFFPREGPGDLTLHVRPGNTIQLGFGMGIYLSGAVGLSVALGGAVSDALEPGPEKVPYEAWLVTGIISAHLLGGGLALALGGETSVEQTDGPHRQARAPRYWLGEF